MPRKRRSVEVSLCRQQFRQQHRASRRAAQGVVRRDNVFDYKFVGLSHNTLRGAAGGAVLLAELLAAKGYFG